MKYQLNWRLSGLPFLTANGELVSAARQAVHDVLGITPQLSTGGGTSDGRFIAPMGAEIVELGPLNTTIHQTNEHVKENDPAALSLVYFSILKKLLV